MNIKGWGIMGKFMKFLLCLGICLFIFGKSANATVNPYPKMQTIDEVTTISCTWFAWQQVYEKYGVELPRWGNAVNWYERAKKANFQVGSEARANSIVIWKNSNSIYGHVAYVVSVEGNTMTINEGGITSLKLNQETNDVIKIPYNGDGIYYNNVVPSIGNRSNTSSLVGFIYLKEEEIIDDNTQSKGNVSEDINIKKDIIKNEDSDKISSSIKEQEIKNKEQIANKSEKNIVKKKNAKKEEKESLKDDLISCDTIGEELKISNVSKENVEKQSKKLSMLRNLSTSIFSLFLVLLKLINIF